MASPETLRIAVPASSANLGPGYDVLAAALSLSLELEVCQSHEFSVDVGSYAVPTDRSNLCVRAFESLHDVDRVAFRLGGDIPVGAGLGSSGAAIVAGLVAANELYQLGHGHDQLLQRAAAIEGHADNVAASLYGGFVICSRQGDAWTADRLPPPDGLEAVAVIPRAGLATQEARAAMPNEVPIADAVHNIASTARLILGLASCDWSLVASGLEDRLHQPRRAHLYPRSIEMVERARDLGALGATISGAGPTVLCWSMTEQSGVLVESLQAEVNEWAQVVRVQFVSAGACVAT